MTVTRMVLLQKASRNLLKDASFFNRWVPLTSIKKGLEIRYKFNTAYPLTKITLSRAMSKIEPMIENLDHKHSSGLYRSKLNNEFFYYQQNSDLDPPSLFDKKSSYKKETSCDKDILL